MAVRPRTVGLIDLPEDFRDLLIELHDRIDILNRADGVTFDEAIDAHASFEVEGRRIPVIGLAALLKNKRAAAREQDLADVSALERIAGTIGP